MKKIEAPRPARQVFDDMRLVSDTNGFVQTAMRSAAQ